MRRITALVLSVILCFSFAAVYADEAPQSYTRMDICRIAAQLFGLQPDGDITPMLAYNDWASVPSDDRYLASAVIKSGIFMPKTSGFLYDSPMTSEDYDALTFGLSLYALSSSEEYSVVSGKITSVNVKTVTITENYTTEHKFSADMPLIKGNGISDTFSDISTGTDAFVVCDKEGSGIIAWAKRQSAVSVNYFQKGKLYLYDEINNNLIFNDLSVLRGGSWVKTDGYLNAAVCDETRIIYKNKKAELKNLNRDYLDLYAEIIVGEKNGQPCILYVLFE